MNVSFYDYPNLFSKNLCHSKDKIIFNNHEYFIQGHFKIPGKRKKANKITQNK